MQITAAIIAFNEEDKIRAALESVKWADEIVVIDSGSTDNTIDIARELGARVISHDWEGFARQKQFAIESASNDWILSLDADEQVSAKLEDEIQDLKSRMDECDGYTIPRLSFYMGREIRHGGWYPDRQLRLFDRRKGKWKDVPVHESFEIAGDGQIGHLRRDLIHFSVDGALHHHRMIGERYAPLAAQAMFAAGKRVSSAGVFMATISTFFATYFLKLGFLDGFPGFCIAWFAAHHAFLKHLLLWEMTRSGE